MTASAYTPSDEYPTYESYRAAKLREYRAAYKARNKAACTVKENARRRRKYASDEEYAAKCKAAAGKAYRAAPEKTKERNRRRAAERPHELRQYFREYNWIKRRRLVRATPAWADLAQIREFYRHARECGMEVDHVVPLAGKNVCGLHVPANLQMLSRTANARKGNKHAD